MSYQTSSKLSRSFWLLIGARKLLCFSAQSEGRTAATVWNWSDKTRGSSRRSLLFFVPYFPALLDFSSPPLSPPGSPRMLSIRLCYLGRCGSVGQGGGRPMERGEGGGGRRKGQEVKILKGWEAGEIGKVT